MTIQHHASPSTSLNVPAHWDERLYSLYGSYNQHSAQSRVPSSSQRAQPQQTSILAQEMNTIWYAEIGEICPPLPIYLAPLLLTFLATAMQGSTDRWRTYCRKIASSKFLMGEVEGYTFKAQLSWIITQDKFNSIESGKYRLGDRDAKRLESSDIERQVPTLIAAQPTVETQALHRYLQQALGTYTYYHWFRDMRVTTGNDQSIRLEVATNFRISRIKNHYASALAAAIKAVYPSSTTYELHVLRN